MAIYNKITTDNASLYLRDIGVKTHCEHVDGEYRLHLCLKRNGDEYLFELSDRCVREYDDIYKEFIEGLINDMMFHHSESIRRLKGGTDLKISGNSITFGGYSQVDLDKLKKIVDSYCSDLYVNEVEYDEEDRGWMYWYKINVR